MDKQETPVISMEIYSGNDLERRVGMKTSVYINQDNEKKLRELVKANPKLTTSGIINEALDDYLNRYSFDTSELRCKKEYRVVVFRLHKEVVRLLVQLKKNFSAKAVNELLMTLILREFDNQSGRTKFPDRLYVGLEYINKLIDRLSKKANLFKVKEIE